MDAKELERLQKELQDKMQNEFIDKLADMVDNYLDKVNKRGYEMTAHEVATFEKVYKQIDYIDKHCR